MSKGDNKWALLYIADAAHIPDAAHLAEFIVVFELLMHDIEWMDGCSTHGMDRVLSNVVPHFGSQQKRGDGSESRLGLITVFLSCVSNFFNSSAVLRCNYFVVGCWLLLLCVCKSQCQGKWSCRSSRRRKQPYTTYLSGLGHF